MKTYTIVRTEGKPGWERVPVLTLDSILWEPDAGVRATAQFCHDAESLYVRLRAAEEDIRAEYTAPLSPVHRDSCLEFFFMPEGGDRYFNFEINPNGCLHIGFGHGRHDSTVLYRRDAAELFAIRTQRTPDGWEAAYRIPLAFLRLFYPEFLFEGVLRANVYKCGDDTPHPHYLAWNPVLTETPDFHRPEYFGKMVFDE